jgi:enoyl-CoA hydratase
VPECLPAYKKLIDDGFAESFGDGLKTERKVSSAANKSVSPDAIAERRAGVQNRGKQQTS